MRDVESAQRQHILVVGPLTFHKTNIEAFFLEKTFLYGRENWRLARQPDVSHAHFLGSSGGRTGVLVAACENKSGESQNGREAAGSHCRGFLNNVITISYRGNDGESPLQSPGNCILSPLPTTCYRPMHDRVVRPVSSNLYSQHVSGIRGGMLGAGHGPSLLRFRPRACIFLLFSAGWTTTQVERPSQLHPGLPPGCCSSQPTRRAVAGMLRCDARTWTITCLGE